MELFQKTKTEDSKHQRVLRELIEVMGKGIIGHNAIKRIST